MVCKPDGQSRSSHHTLHEYIQSSSWQALIAQVTYTKRIILSPFINRDPAGTMSDHDALDLDLNAVEKAFGAYLTTIIGGSTRDKKVTFLDLADGRIISEALHHE